VLESDAPDDSSRQRRGPARCAALTRLARRLEVLAEEALELGIEKMHLRLACHGWSYSCT
jgi:hypothetical protein